MKYAKLFVALMMATPAFAQKPCTVKGQLADDVNSKKLYVYVSNPDLILGQDCTDSVIVKGGKFTYTTKFAELRRALFVPSVEGGKGVSMNQLQVMLVPGEQAEVKIGKTENSISGSSFYKQWNGVEEVRKAAEEKVRTFAREASAKLQTLSEEERQTELVQAQAKLNELIKSRETDVTAYAKEHINEEGCALYCILNMNPSYTYYDMAGDAVKNGRFGALLKERAEDDRAREAEQAKSKAIAQEAQSKTQEGMMFTDFEAEYNGKIQKLSDYVGKGKYVLVDFWASWCGPCKAEIPNLIEVYNKYKGDKFEVIGVATWDKPKDTEKSIEQMKIPYPQIMNAQKAGSDAYGIEGIPQIILFGPDGKIIKRNLRGEAIEAKVKEVLQ